MERLLSVWWQAGGLTKRASGEVCRRIVRYISCLHGGATKKSTDQGSEGECKRLRDPATTVVDKMGTREPDST
jgi:hypothetical protein